MEKKDEKYEKEEKKEKEYDVRALGGLWVFLEEDESILLNDIGQNETDPTDVRQTNDEKEKGPIVSREGKEVR